MLTPTLSLPERNSARGRNQDADLVLEWSYVVAEPCYHQVLPKCPREQVAARCSDGTQDAHKGQPLPQAKQSSGKNVLKHGGEEGIGQEKLPGASTDISTFLY